jgi:pimeloyl-ACP methyl ester carboxylesterase|tara:strand:+ start:93 stop:884 length:792 start_codon:yes stop_codon:yes gene_type:complete
MLVRAVFLLLYLVSLNIHAEKFEVDDVILDYEIIGKGQPLLLLHGGFLSKEAMRPQINHLKGDFEVIALDSREHGLSTASQKPISYEQMYQDTLALIEHLKLKKVNLLGYSDGGIIGLMLASRNPQLVDRMVLIGANYHWNGLLEKKRNEFSKMKASDSPDFMKENFYKNRGTVAGFEDYFEEMMTMFLTSPTMKLNELSSIESEVLIIAGDRDSIDIGHTISIFQAIKGSHLFIVPDADHFVIFKKPALTNSVMSDFLIPKQ